MISGPKYCMDTTYIGKCTSWVSVRRQCDFRLQYSTGCLFHGQQFESQQELRTENGILTWQVTYRAVLTQRGIVEIKFNSGMSTDLLCDRGMCGISVLPR